MACYVTIGMCRVALLFWPARLMHIAVEYGYIMQNIWLRMLLCTANASASLDYYGLVEVTQFSWHYVFLRQLWNSAYNLAISINI